VAMSAQGRDHCAGILVVDDDDGIRSALAQALEEEGFLVSTAAHGAEALDYLRTAGVMPCLILLDIMMPVLDGRGFLQLKRVDARLADIPVVVVTADGRALQDRAALDVQAVLMKPISLEVLLETVSQYCSRTQV
jgi:two-component system chemotaxis response regulator CheY